jgi:hypothetical protein
MKQDLCCRVARAEHGKYIQDPEKNTARIMLVCLKELSIKELLYNLPTLSKGFLLDNCCGMYNKNIYMVKSVQFSPLMI